jgi:hypothetical protein
MHVMNRRSNDMAVGNSLWGGNGESNRHREKFRSREHEGCAKEIAAYQDEAATK